MKIYDTASIRNVALVGHGGSGKTSLVSAILFDAGAVNRLGKVEEGNTVTDFDADEIARQISLSTALAHCEWNKTKLNLLDTPGYGNFIQEARVAIHVADAALVNVCGVAGVEVQTEKVWGFANESGRARMLVVNRLDRDRASFSRALESIQKAFGRTAVPIQLPVGEEKDFRGVVDLVRMKAYLSKGDDKGTHEEKDVPSEMKDEVEAARSALVEMVAEVDDALMEKYLETGALSPEEFLSGLKLSVVSGKVFPVLAVSGVRNVGVRPLMDALVDLTPAPDARSEAEGKDSHGNPVSRKIAASAPASAFIFKTIADPFAGRISLFRVMSGVVRSDSTYQNTTKDVSERLGSVSLLQGKETVPVSEVQAGDLASVAKLKESQTGDTLADKGSPIIYPKFEFPEPVISFAIEPKSRGDEEKISSAMQRLSEEDPMLKFHRESELLLSGTGQLHIEVAVSRLKQKFGVEVTLHPPKVPYRETISGTFEAHGRHKKQTGGHGQFADCWVRFEPLQRGAQFEFANEVFGGAIPKNFIPAVEKGIQEARVKGFLAGFPMVDFKATVYDGKYHPVDSSEMAFKIAGSLAYKEAMEKCKPTLLEPIMNVEIVVPEENTGDVLGDLNSRRGRTQGMEPKGSLTSIKAQVPMSEMLSYEPTLTSMTGGRGSFHMEYSHYEEVPSHLVQKIVAERKAEKEAKA
ncbi:MAG TPA: elongation factor G [Vicinamibacteria bacterium]|nr:elongation factor G [Vicinamibacteria bacterium]